MSATALESKLGDDMAELSGHNHTGNSKPMIPANALITMQTSSQDAAFRRRLVEVFHPHDRSQFEELASSYCELRNLISQWMPQRIVEIGVRAGYSAFTFLDANPKAIVIGIDADGDEHVVETHGGRQGLWRHACALLSQEQFNLIIVDSHRVQRLPQADLVYIDGDHSFAGCLADLRLASASTDRILVDDYDNLAEVRQACDTFAQEQSRFHGSPLPGGKTGFFVLERRTDS